MIEFLVIIVCLAFSAFFSGSETALLRLRASDVDKAVATSHGPAAPAVRELLRSTERLLVTILLGNNLVNLLAAGVASALAVAAFGERNGLFLSTFLLTIVVLVFCEVLPKAVAARNPGRFAHAIALPLYLVHQIVRPVHVVFDRWIDPLVERVSGTKAMSESILPEDVLHIATQAGAGQPPGTPLAIMAAVADAVDTQVHEIMVLRDEIVAYPVDTAPAELLESFLRERYTRAPIYADSIDNCVGVVHFRELVVLVRRGGTNLREIIQPVLRVPEGKRILELLTEMQRAFVQMAVVKDEFGATEGILSQEDILEELVGEIRDEFDSEELEAIQSASEDSYQVMARLRVLDFNRRTGWEIPSERGETLAGLVFNVLAPAPREGDVVRVGGYELGVIGVSGARITRLLVSKRAEPTGEPAGEEGPTD